MTETAHPAEWQPRDENGQFKEQGMQRCRECEGTGTVSQPVGDPDAPDATGYDTLTQEQTECDRCDGRGAEYKPTGCPRCDADDLSSTLMPSSSYKQRCSECGWWEMVG